MHKEEAVWTWLSGQPLSISHWGPDQPANKDKYAIISGAVLEGGSPGKFTEEDGQSMYGVLCEIPGGKLT